MLKQQSMWLLCIFVLLAGLVVSGVWHAIASYPGQGEATLLYGSWATFDAARQARNAVNEHAIANQEILVSWEGCRLGDERLRLLAARLRQLADEETTRREYGEPARWTNVETGMEAAARLMLPGGAALSEPEALHALEGKLVGPEFLQGVLLDARERRRAKVAAVEHGSPAAEAGLAPGDEILQINGSPIAGYAEARSVLLSCHEQRGDGTMTVITARHPAGLTWRRTMTRPARQAAVRLELTAFGAQPEELSTTLSRVRELATRDCAVPAAELRVSGTPVRMAALRREAQVVLPLLALVGLVAACVLCGLWLRNWQLALIVGGTGMLTGATSLALAWYGQFRLDVWLLLMPSLVSAVALIPAALVARRYRDELAGLGMECAPGEVVGPPQRHYVAAAAVRASVLPGTVGLSGLGAAFFALCGSGPAELFAAGVSGGVAALAALAWVYLFLPACLVCMPLSTEGAKCSAERGVPGILVGAIVGRPARWLQTAAVRCNKLSLAGGAAGTALMLYYVAPWHEIRLRTVLFTARSAVAKEEAWIASRLGAQTPLELTLRAPASALLTISDASGEATFALRFGSAAGARRTAGERKQTVPLACGISAEALQQALRGAGLEKALVIRRTARSERGSAFEIILPDGQPLPELEVASSAEDQDASGKEPRVVVTNPPSRRAVLELVRGVEAAIERLKGVVGVASAADFFAGTASGFAEANDAEAALALARAQQAAQEAGWIQHRDGQDLYRLAVRTAEPTAASTARLADEVQRAVTQLLEEPSSAALNVQARYRGPAIEAAQAQAAVPRGVAVCTLAALAAAGSSLLLCTFRAGPRGLPGAMLGVLPSAVAMLVAVAIAAALRMPLAAAAPLAIAVALAFSMQGCALVVARFQDEVQRGVARGEAALAAAAEGQSSLAPLALLCIAPAAVLAASSLTPVISLAALAVILITAGAAANVAIVPVILASPAGWWFARRREAKTATPSWGIPKPHGGMIRRLDAAGAGNREKNDRISGSQPRRPLGRLARLANKLFGLRRHSAAHEAARDGAGRMVVIEARELTKVFGMGEARVEALKGVDLKVHEGEFVAIMGASGSGKSTLLYLLGGIDVPTSGQVLLEGVDLASLSDDRRTLMRRQRIGFIFQSFNLLPTLTAEENVALPLELDGVSSAEARRRAAEMLEVVGVLHRSGHIPSTLSGGEQQRVAIARALVTRPAMLLADEPTGNLDSANGQVVIRILRRLVDEKKQTIVMVTHDPVVAELADRIVRIRDGRIASDSETSTASARRELVERQ